MTYKTTLSAAPSAHASWLGGLDARLEPSLDELARLSNKDFAKRIALRNDIVKTAIPLADRLARRFTHRGEAIDDLTQVARLALIKAVNNFSPEHGVLFSRFAVPSILGELKRHFRDKGWLLRVPRRLKETRLAVNQASEPLTQRLGRTPTDAEYARYLSIPQQQVRAGIDCTGSYDGVPLEAPTGSDSDADLSDSLGHNDKHLERADDRVTLGALTDRLTPRERHLLALRFGKDMTQTQIASQLGLSQMHVSRLLRRTLSQLREAMREQPRDAPAPEPTVSARTTPDTYH